MERRQDWGGSHIVCMCIIMDGPEISQLLGQKDLGLLHYYAHTNCDYWSPI